MSLIWHMTFRQGVLQVRKFSLERVKYLINIGNFQPFHGTMATIPPRKLHAIIANTRFHFQEALT